MSQQNITFQAYGATHVGQRREVNEDSYLDLPQLQAQGGFIEPSLIAFKGQLWVIADGMGGHVGGAKASNIVVERIFETYYSLQPEMPDDSLHHAIIEANKHVYEFAQEHPDYDGMGSTLVAVVLRGDTLYTAWVGDSRLYRLREGQLERITHDHSWVQEAVDQGILTPEEAEHHPNRNQILRSMGGHAQVEPELVEHTVHVDDVYLLCSDGLSGVIPDAEIAETLQAAATPQAAVEQLIVRANELGGPDNITAAVIAIEAGPPPPLEEQPPAVLNPHNETVPTQVSQTPWLVITVAAVIVSVLLIYLLMTAFGG